MAKTENITYDDLEVGQMVWFHHEGASKHFDGDKKMGRIERVEDNSYKWPIKVRLDLEDRPATFIEPYEIDAILDE